MKFKLALGAAALLSAFAAQESNAVIMNVNLARTGTATQSSTAFGGNASFGNDGGLGTSFGVDATTSHTDNIANSSWQVNLGTTTTLNSVELFNRGDCCQTRLSNFTLSVLDSGNNTVFSQVVAGPVGASQSFALPAVVGQTVKVQLNGTNNASGGDGGPSGFLSLREVVVKGNADVVNGSNLARLYGTATQSSTLDNSFRPAAHKAIDGNTNGAFTAGSTTHTNDVANSFWEVDLNSTFHIDNLRLFNRTDCCGGRLSDYDITIFDANHNLVTTIVNNGAFGTGFHAVPFGTQGRFVRVQLDGQNLDLNGVLSLAEVQVNGGGFANIARNPLAVATQSSTLANPANPIASDAIDGITNGLFQGTGSDFSVTHTNAETNPFWNLDFGNDFDVDEIVLFNRTDCCSDRLSGAEIRLFNDQGNQIFLATLGNTTGLTEFRIDPNGLRAGSLQILLPGAGRILSLAEVQVFGVQSIPEPATALMGIAGLAGLAIRRRRVA